jgi:small GTP-binding protein
MLGDTFTGKTSLVLRFAEGYYRDSSRDATVGAEFMTKKVTVHGKTSKIQIWDTAGQEQFKKLASMYYKQSAAAIICYDASSPKTFDALKYWIDELQQNAPRGLVIAVCATKCDLVQNPDFSEAEQLAQSVGALFFTTSAKDNTNVTSVFEKVTERVFQVEREDPDSIKVSFTPRSAPGSPVRSGGFFQPTTNSSPIKQKAFLPDSSMADEKREIDDTILQNPSTEDNKSRSSTRCADMYMCGDVDPDEIQKSCIIS